MINHLLQGSNSRPCCCSGSLWTAALSSPWHGCQCRLPSDRPWSSWRSRSPAGGEGPHRRAPSHGPGTLSRGPILQRMSCRMGLLRAGTRSRGSCWESVADQRSGCKSAGMWSSRKLSRTCVCNDLIRNRFNLSLVSSMLVSLYSSAQKEIKSFLQTYSR